MIYPNIPSQKGQTAIKEYPATPQGKQTAVEIPPRELEVTDLPDNVKNSIRENLGKKT